VDVELNGATNEFKN